MPPPLRQEALFNFLYFCRYFRSLPLLILKTVPGFFKAQQIRRQKKEGFKAFLKEFFKVRLRGLEPRTP